jgi:ABC-type transport system involved in multi-copper enzyme maturation permease subunit
MRAPNPRHVWLMANTVVRYAIRGGSGIVFLLLVLATGLLVAQAFLAPIEALARQASLETQTDVSSEMILGQLVEFAQPAVQWVLGETEGEGWASYLLEERPAIISAIVLVLSLATPALVVTGAFNQFSRDVQTRGLRYLLTRTTRSSLFFGRFIGTVLFTTAVLAVLVLVIALYVGFKLQIYPWLDLLSWSAYGLLVLCIVALPYVALCSWISGTIDSPFGSLTLASLIIGTVPLFARVGELAWEPLRYINYLLPWSIQTYLLHPSLLLVLGAVLACLMYTGVFLWLGHRHFSRRDL